MSAVTELVGGGPEPLLVHRPASGAPSPWVVMVHAPGENRTGNNYWQAHAAGALAAAGFTAARFDLCGYGESLAEKDVATWRRQIDAAIRIAAGSGATAIAVTARGLHCGLLDDVDALRIALFPPDAEELGWWTLRPAAPTGTDIVEVAAGMDAEERAFWEACGLESNLAGGLEIPAPVLDELSGRSPRADVVVVPAHDDRRPRAGRLVCGRDPLTRLESDRAGLEHLLITWLGRELRR
jgi:hypothetical protein